MDEICLRNDSHNSHRAMKGGSEFEADAAAEEMDEGADMEEEEEEEGKKKARDKNDDERL